MATIPSSADVSGVSASALRPRRVRVPAVTSVGGAALKAVAEVGSEFVDRQLAAENRISARRESLDRIRSGHELNEFGNATFTQYSSEQDFSRQETIDAYGATLNAKAEEIRGAYQGSDEAKLRLNERLEPILSSLRDKGAVAGVKAQDALLEQENNDLINGLAARVRLGEDPRLLIAEGMGHLNAEADSYRPGQEIAFVRNLNARVYGAKVEDLIAKGGFDEAEDLFNQPEVRSAIGEKGQRRVFDRIAAIRREGKARILTEPESVGLGFPKGVLVQKKADGSFNVVFKPEQDVTERERKITDLVNRGVEKGRAQDIVDGNIRVEIVPSSGKAREINEVTGEVREVDFSEDELPSAPAPEQKDTLFDLARGGSIAGIVPAAQEFLGRTIGQIPGVPVATDVIEARQKVRVAQNELIRAMSINPRFPVAEMNRIREEIKIEPSLLDSQRALLSRMKGIDSALRIRMANEQAAADNVNLPQQTRINAAQATKDIGNFLNLLGVPNDYDVDQIVVPEGVPEFSSFVGSTREGKDVWQSPDGRRWVVE